MPSKNSVSEQSFAIKISPLYLQTQTSQQSNSRFTEKCSKNFHGRRNLSRTYKYGLKKCRKGPSYSHGEPPFFDNNDAILLTIQFAGTISRITELMFETLRMNVPFRKGKQTNRVHFISDRNRFNNYF